MGTFAKSPHSRSSEASNHQFISLEIVQIPNPCFKGSMINVDEGKLIEVELVVIHVVVIQAIVDAVTN